METKNDIILRRKGNGFALEGPGYYVWDEDPREVVRVAADLRLGRVPPRPTQRMLLVPPLPRIEPETA